MNEVTRTSNEWLDHAIRQAAIYREVRFQSPAQMQLCAAVDEIERLQRLCSDLQQIANGATRSTLEPPDEPVAWMSSINPGLVTTIRHEGETSNWVPLYRASPPPTHAPVRVQVAHPIRGYDGSLDCEISAEVASRIAVDNRHTEPPSPARKPDKFDLAFEIMRQLEAEDMETMQSCQFGFVMRVTREGAGCGQVEFRPIATAPRDGSTILLRCPKGIVEGCWEQVDGGGHPENGPPVYWWTSPFTEFIDGPYDAPTHWALIPRDALTKGDSRGE